MEIFTQAISAFKWYHVIEIIILWVGLYLSFSYYKKRNAVWYGYFLTLFAVLTLGMRVLGFVSSVVFILLLVCAFTIAPAILFANDLRRDLFKLSYHNNFFDHRSALDFDHLTLEKSSESIVQACQNMSKNDIGALIVITDNISDAILESGTIMNSLLTAELLETLFTPKSPLHDGAVIVNANKVVAAGCYLPLSNNKELPKEFGTRHRAAIGISENNPAVTAIIVSEETGIISAAHNGKIVRYLDGKSLANILEYALKITTDDSHDSTWRR